MNNISVNLIVQISLNALISILLGVFSNAVGPYDNSSSFQKINGIITVFSMIPLPFFSYLLNEHRFKFLYMLANISYYVF